jgi:hypothetical protein
LLRTVRMMDGEKIQKQEWIEKNALANERLIEDLLPGELISWEIVVSIE